MAAINGRNLCQFCQRPDPTVCSRGCIDLMVELCDGCWNRFTNDLAMLEGATAPPCPAPDPDDVEAIGPPEPPTCPKCHHSVRRYPTNYNKWVDLATCDLPAKDVPEPYRWRLTKGSGPHAGMWIAVRVHAICPLPSDLVLPAHAFLCPGEEAERQDLAP
ncbi:DUF6083 domain-containing protein [Streptomyces shenzhenensis]|uniref:DUF6083 domain-containing protein n=2 Tax=Streptomyces shenzhenensis TaxID=943815 RepID=UPI0036C739F2